MPLDREYQRQLLCVLRDAYPNWVDLDDLPEHSAQRANLLYLAEHGLVKVRDIRIMQDPTRVDRPRITVEGLDFLEDDGGVSAILRTVTVKIDPDDLRSMMAARIEASELPDEEKSSLMHAIRSLPARALQDLTTRLVNEAVARWPDALQLLQKHVSLGL